MNGEVDLNALMAAVNEVRDTQKELVNRMTVMEENHKKAFPGGDFEGHRRYHETMQEVLEEKRKLRVAVQEKTISALVWSGIVGLGFALWHEFCRIIGVMGVPK